MKGPYVPLSVGYRENDRVLGVEPLAELLFVRSLAFAKEKFADGFIRARQLRTLGHDLESTYTADLDDLAGQLVTVGLWAAVDGGWLIEGWQDWNSIDSSRAGTLGNHVRWHTTRGIIDPSCDHCASSPPIAPDIAPTRGGDRGESQSIQISTEKTTRSAAVEAEFETWWTDYPRKVGKGSALAPYRKARQSASADDLASGLHRSVNQWRRENRPMDKIPHASTWLNGQRWLDTYEETQANTYVDADGNVRSC